MNVEHYSSSRRTYPVLFAATLALPSVSDARVKKIVVEKKVSPAFDGATFGAAGQYETLAGRAFGELDPNDPRNALITDIALAPKNAARQGRVHRQLLPGEADRHVEEQPPDVAGRAESRRPHHIGVRASATSATSA